MVYVLSVFMVNFFFWIKILFQKETFAIIETESQ